MKKKRAAKKKLNTFWEKVEHYNSKLIPWAIIALLLIIIFELFIHLESHAWELTVEILDYLVIAIFIVDLIFLAKHSRNVSFFFKHYWLDIIAIIPVVLVFTIISYVYRAVSAAGRIVVGQQILHESLEAKKSFAVLARSQKFAKYVRVGMRSLRAVTKSRLFTKVKKHRR